MELDEMKTAWRELDDRLDRQEMMSANFIKESLASRSQRSANKFLNMEIIGAVAVLAILPFAVRQYGMPWVADRPGANTVLLVAIALMLLILVWQLVKLRPLFGIDMTKGVSDNISRVRRYELYTQYEKRVAIFFAPFLLLAVMIWRAVVMNDAPWYWAALAGMVLVAVLCCVWYYKKFYAANMRAIKRGLEELKDL
jgi:hypothetical protein